MASNRAQFGAQGAAEAVAPPVAVPRCDRLWSVGDVAEFLEVPVSTLHQWRYQESGPAAFRVGKHLRYDPDVVRRWLVDSCSGVA